MWDGPGNGVCPNKPDFVEYPAGLLTSKHAKVRHTSYTSNKERSKTLRRSVVDDNFG